MSERILASDATLDELEASRTFETFYQAEARTLFRRLWLVTANRAEAEELMQDAFLRVWERSPRGDRILFSSIVFSKSGRMGESSLWSVGVDGSNLRLVVSGTVQGEWLSR